MMRCQLEKRILLRVTRKDPPMRINVYYRSFLPSTIRKWNTLPDYIIASSSIDLFISIAIYYKH